MSINLSWPRFIILKVIGRWYLQIESNIYSFKTQIDFHLNKLTKFSIIGRQNINKKWQRKFPFLSIKRPVRKTPTFLDLSSSSSSCDPCITSTWHPLHTQWFLVTASQHSNYIAGQVEQKQFILWPRMLNRFTLLPSSFNYFLTHSTPPTHIYLSLIHHTIKPNPNATIPHIHYVILLPYLDLCLHCGGSSSRPCRRLNGTLRWTGIRLFVQLGPGQEPTTHGLGATFHLDGSPLLQTERPVVIYFLAQQPGREDGKWERTEKIGLILSLQHILQNKRHQPTHQRRRIVLLLGDAVIILGPLFIANT